MNPSRNNNSRLAFRDSSSFGLSSGKLSSSSPLGCIVEPPDLSLISDANIVVLVKNLLKKDENTKSKALEDLHSQLKTGELDDPVVAIWVQLYPRLSIDTSRRVRHLSHTLLGYIGGKIGKKMSKHMPKIVGSWLSGLYDPDRSVQRATRDSLVCVFNSEDKIKSLWTVYEGTILEYCTNTIVNESVYTLSDERSVSPDDAHAKFARVMGTCIMSLNHLISVLSIHKLEERMQTYSAVIAHKHLWNFTHHSDAFLRRSTYKLLQTILNTDPALVQTNLKTISTCIIVKASAHSQTGSVESYLDTLLLLTSKLPESWFVVKQDKQAPIYQFLRFVEKGSNLSPPTFWEKIATIFTIIPSNALFKTTSVQECISAIMKPLSNGQEPQTNLIAGWKCYFTVCFRLLGQCPLDSVSQDFVLNESLFSVFEACVIGEDTQLRLFGNADRWKLCATGLLELEQFPDHVQQKFISQVWHRLESVVIDESPASSNILKHRKSWVRLCAECIPLLQQETLIYATIQKSFCIILSQTMESLDLSKGNDLDTAILLEHTIALAGSGIYKYPETKNKLAQFFNETIENLLNSESIQHLLAGFVTYLVYLEDQGICQWTWDRLMNIIMESSLNDHSKELAVQMVLKSGSQKLSHKIQSCSVLDLFIRQKLKSLLSSINTQENDWKIIKHSAASSGSLVSSDVLQTVLNEITKSLAQVDADAVDFTDTIQKLEVISEAQPHQLYLFMNSQDGKQLLTRLFTLSNVSNEFLSMAAEAAQKAVWNAILSNTNYSQTILEVIVDVISSSVQQCHGGNTYLEYLLTITQELFTHANNTQADYLSEHLLFSEEQWKYAFQDLLPGKPDISIATVNSLGGCIFLVNNTLNSTPTTEGFSKEKVGYSSALRMATFAMGLISVVDTSGRTLPSQTKAFLLYVMCLIQEFAKDNNSVSGVNGLWKHGDPNADTDVLKLIGDSQEWVNKCLGFGNNDSLSTMVLECFYKNSRDLSPISFYSTRGLAALLTNLGFRNSVFRKNGVEWLESTNFGNINDTFWTCAILVGLRDSVKSDLKGKICSNLMTSIPEINTLQLNLEGCLKSLLILNAVLPTRDEGPIAEIPQPRIITLIKAVLRWFGNKTENVDINTGLLAEVSNLLGRLLPLVKGIYGEHWQLTLNFIKDCWEGCMAMNNEDIPLLLSTLRLFEIIRCLLGENEDVDDAWDMSERELYQMLLKFLLGAKHDSLNQPRNICNMQISRQVRDIKSTLIEDIGILYSVIGVQCRPIQQAAFDILHREIPALQEQVSIAFAASTQVDHEVALPADILSLIIDAPQLTEDDIDSPTDEYVTTARGYLLGWLLVYDHFENAIFSVKTLYSDILKDGKYIPVLLNYISGDLFSKGRNYDTTKIDVAHYVSGTGEDPLRDLRSLEIHIYYLALRHTPSLVKAWWLECSNRSIVLAVENFTEKFMSPLLIDHELTAVSEWAQARDSAEDLIVKVAKVVKEVIVSCPIDDQFMEIAVRLPTTFPLRLVEIKGLRRVGLKEDHFQQLLRASQAVVNFQSGSIIDAISLFQKNVSLHFQGIIECAICYSILAVTPDRALPKRACSTCKNKFHSTCLLKWFKTSGSSSCPLCKFSVYLRSIISELPTGRTSISFYT
ncbi:hypothetical protein EDC01DRAFT_613943 [Geopyxis carbonaria]|nr:hypothetical protein EDC01DRAFT_613943 [Geopyxis carbonaria]